MITVLKHGKPRYQMTCDTCECVFTFEEEDIQNKEFSPEFFPWIKCPECQTKLYIQDYNLMDKNF